MLVMLFVCNVIAEDLIKKFARPGPKPDLYYSGVMVGKTYYVAGTGDGRPESPDESYAVKTKRCFASIQRSLQMAGLDLENVVQAWVMLEDPEAVKDMTAAWKETFPRKFTGTDNLQCRQYSRAIADGDYGDCIFGPFRA